LLHLWSKYKPEEFLFEVIETIEGTTLKRRTVEQQYVDKFWDDSNFLNHKRKVIQKEGPWSQTPEETRKKISKTRKLKLETGEIIPTKHTKEHKEKLRKYNPGGKATSKEVLQICPQTGKVIKNWPSTRQAGLGIGYKSWRNISYSINQNPHRTVGGFYWRWPDSKDIVDDRLSSHAQLNENRKLCYNNAKPVKQFEPTGKLIKVWPSMSEAARQNNCQYNGISLAIKYNKSYKGYVWKLQ